ncbi:MAG: hypothetical protein MJY61_06025 [Bacteroidales bacterium]|nr:hypothetical protein [Bacteroidales bacterium]
MNLRVIKKDIEYVLGAFIEDCSVVAAVKGQDADESVSALMDEAIDLYNELKDKVNAKIEGPKKAYFAGLRKEILTRTDALYEKLSEAVKSGKGAAEKKPAAKKPAEKPAAKKPAAEKPTAEKKAPAKKTGEAAAEKKTPAKKPAEKKAPAKKAPAKKAE